MTTYEDLNTRPLHCDVHRNDQEDILLDSLKKMEKYIMEIMSNMEEIKRLKS